MPTPLKELRETKGFSQDDLSRASTVSKSVIVDLELRRRKPRPSTRRRLARSLKVKPEDIDLAVAADT